MNDRCERCDGSGIVFKPGLPGLDDKGACPECGGEGVVAAGTNPGENATEARQGEVVPKYQWTNGEVLTLRAEVERLRAIIPFTSSEMVFADGREPTTNERHLFNLLTWREHEAQGLKEEIARLRSSQGENKEIARLRSIIEQSNAVIEHTLGTALYGVPTEEGCPWGEQIAETLAIDAAREIGSLREELADLRSREVIECSGIYFAPLAITNGTWEWFDASDGFCAYVGGESIPSELYVALPGVNLEKFAMAYPTREAVLQALRDAIEATKQQNQ